MFTLLGRQLPNSITVVLTMYFLLCCQPVVTGADGPTAGSAKCGLQVSEFYDKTSHGALPVYVVKIDPAKYRFKLLSASENEGGARTLKGWSEEFGLEAVINAGMYQEENINRSTGFMKNFGHHNNPTINPRYGAFLAFNPLDPLLPPVQFIDRRSQPDWKQKIGQYQTVVQNYRMISAGEQTGWSQDRKPHSTAALGMDGKGNVLFIFSSMPRTTNDFISLLLKLPLDIRDAMYLEGGPYAGIYCRNDAGRSSGSDLDRLPSSKVPNVIGAVSRK
jgi:hypothetical protein